MLGDLGEVTVNQLEGLCGHERDMATEQLVEGDAEGVEVGAVIEGPIHAPGLLGRDVGECALEAVGGHGQGLALVEAGRDSKVDVLDPLSPAVDQDISGLDVLVDDALGVDRREPTAELEPDVHEAGDGEPALGDALGERDPVEVLHHDRGVLLRDLHVEVTHDVRMIDAVADLPLSAQPAHGQGAGSGRSQSLEDHAHPVAGTARAHDP